MYEKYQNVTPVLGCRRHMPLAAKAFMFWILIIPLFSAGTCSVLRISLDSVCLSSSSYISAPGLEGVRHRDNMSNYVSRARCPRPNLCMRSRPETRNMDDDDVIEGGDIWAMI